jgi:hypothetical protein
MRRALLIAACLCSLPARLSARQDVTVELGQRFGAFTVINRGVAVRLDPTVAVEQRVAERWQRIPVSNLQVRDVCGEAGLRECVPLAGGGSIRVAAWTGNYCSAQCPAPCRLDGQAPAGTYRFVVHDCGGRLTFASPSFEKP